MPPAFDVPAPLAAVIITVVTIALTYLMTVDWTHPTEDR